MQGMYVSSEQQALLALFSRGYEATTVVDLPDWKFGTELIEAGSLEVGNYLLVPSAPPGGGIALDLGFVAESHLWVLKVVSVTILAEVRIQVLVVGPLSGGGSLFETGRQYFVAISAESWMLIAVPSSPLFLAMAAVFAGRHGEGDDQGPVQNDPSVDLPAPRKRKLMAGGGNTGLSDDEEEDEDIQDCLGSVEAAVPVCSGKFFRDLDGVRRYPSSTKSLEAVFEFRALFRVMDEERVDALLEDYRYVRDRWRNLAVMYQSYNFPPDVNSPMASFTNVNNTVNLPVWRDEMLFDLFIKCLWSPFNWSVSCLALDKFLCDEDRSVVWRDEPSSVGRGRLAVALSNVSMMASVHFGGAFTGALQGLVTFLEYDPKNILGSIHDLVLRYHVEVMLFQFFDDVRSQKVSQVFPGESMRCPKDCVNLLQLYIGRLKEGLMELVRADRAPHFHFYGGQGQSRHITLDEATFQRLTCRRVFAGSISSGWVPRAGPGGVTGRGDGVRSVAAGVPARTAASHKPVICFWHLAGLLKMKKVDGSLYSCTGRECGVSQHPPLAAMKLGEVGRCVEAAKAGRKIKAAVASLVEANKSSFSV